MATGVVSFQNGSYFGGSSTASLDTSLTSGGIPISSFYNIEFLNDKNEYMETREAYEVQHTALDSAIDSIVSNIISYIRSGQEDKAMEAYNKLLEQMASQTRYTAIAQDETQLRAVARQLIESQLEEDENLETLIRDNTRDAVAVQRQQCYRGDKCDTTTQEALLKAMCDIDEEEGELNWLGKGFHGFCGLFAKGWNAIFGDGKKH